MNSVKPSPKVDWTKFPQISPRGLSVETLQAMAETIVERDRVESRALVEWRRRQRDGEPCLSDAGLREIEDNMRALRRIANRIREALGEKRERP